MFKIDNNFSIHLSRGDSCEFPVFLNQGTAQAPVRFVLDENDCLYFYIVPLNKPFEKAVVAKCFTRDDLNENEDVVVKIHSKDTINLPEGQYNYAIRVMINDGSGDYDWATARTYTPFYVVGV